ncbi:hypothetical protein [Absidia glauca]|uniref:Uncharacterized protein n=1 Tax=Absidia glauca TaxID=4829 RepID=A0A168L0W1_ABSGL|nr:hypothetical protein [Absidia glauca]
MKTTTLSPAYEKLSDTMTPTNIAAITNRQRGHKRSLNPDTNTPMLTRKRAALISPIQQATTEGTSTIQSQGHSPSSLYATTSPSLPSPSNSLDLPPPPSFPPFPSASRTPTTILQKSPAQSTNSTDNTQGPPNNSFTLGQKRRKSVPTPPTSMVTRKRASISRPSDTQHKTNTSLDSSQLKSLPSPSALASLDTDSLMEHQSEFDKTPESADDEEEDHEMLLASKDLHPELFMMMQDIEKKKKDRIRLAIARRDAQLKSHQTYFDSIVHKANMEFITNHNNLINDLHAKISRRRLKLCSEHATSTEDIVYRANGRAPSMELPHPPHGLSHQDSNEDIGLIHVK